MSKANTSLSPQNNGRYSNQNDVKALLTIYSVLLSRAINVPLTSQAIGFSRSQNCYYDANHDSNRQLVFITVTHLTMMHFKMTQNKQWASLCDSKWNIATIESYLTLTNIKPVCPDNMKLFLARIHIPHQIKNPCSTSERVIRQNRNKTKRNETVLEREKIGQFL